MTISCCSCCAHFKFLFQTVPQEISAGALSFVCMVSLCSLTMLKTSKLHFFLSSHLNPDIPSTSCATTHQVDNCCLLKFWDHKKLVKEKGRNVRILSPHFFSCLITKIVIFPVGIPLFLIKKAVVIPHFQSGSKNSVGIPHLMC